MLSLNNKKMLLLIMIMIFFPKTSDSLLYLHQNKSMNNNHGGIHNHINHNLGVYHTISNNTIAGIGSLGCKYSTKYETTPIASFQMCTGQKDQDLKNGMSIINLIGSRGYLPTCRIMQLMLWMASEINDKKILVRDLFVDIGANIGSCTVHMASLGFPVVAAEPVQEHIDTIKGSIDINPSFRIDLHHVGISVDEKVIRANFGHGARNWGATEFHEVSGNDTAEAELALRTFDQIVGHRRISLVKIDCEGCEWAAIKGASRNIKKIPMMKVELVQPDYTAGNETVTSQHILRYLQSIGFDLYIDHWDEKGLYFGKRGNDILDIDQMFGSAKFKITSDLAVLNASAVKILRSQVDPETFNRKRFIDSATDIIAIERSLSEKMKRHFLNM
jgi:FkbM family methyltransferase